MNFIRYFKTGDLFVGSVLLVLSIILYFESFNMKAMLVAKIGPGFAPRLVAIGIFILSLILLIQVISNGLKKIKKEKENGTENKFNHSNINITKYLNVTLSAALIFMYVFLIPRLGFLISSMIYLVIHFSLLCEKKYWKWPLFIGVSVISSVVIYYSFRTGFKVLLPEGILK